MKGKNKTQKGITLVALIITIVVLIILAVISVASITNDGIFKKSEQAADEYNQSAKDEQDTLVGYINDLNKYPMGSGSGEGTEDGEDSESGSGSGSSTTTITFSINETQFTANSGMTWGQWINSEYNTNVSFATDGKLFNYGNLVATTAQEQHGSTVVCWYPEGMEPVHTYDNISAGHSYWTYFSPFWS